MENNLQIFNYGSIDVRIMAQDSEPWFVAKDVCEILGLTDVTSALRTLDDDEKLVRKISGAGQVRMMATINESGLYTLIMRSTKPGAKQFRKWVTGTVLPSIRKTGFYATPNTIDSIIADPDNFIKVLQELKATRTKAAELETQIENDRPKVLFAEAVDASKDSILIGNFATILKQKGIDIGQNRLFAWFRENGWLIRCRGERWNLPTQRGLNRGFFEVKQTVITNPDGSKILRPTPKITGKGQIFFTNGFLTGEFSVGSEVRR